MLVLAGSTDVTTYFQLRLAANGADATGLTISDFDMQYVRTGATPTAKVDAVALAAANTAHTDNRGIEVDATDTPGLYRFDWPDAAFASGVLEAILTIKHASIFTESLRVQIVGFNPADGVRMGLTALPNAAADAAGGLPISDAGGLNLDGLATASALATVDTVVDTISANVGTAGAGLTAVPWNSAWDAEVQSEATDALNAYDPPTRTEATADKDEILTAVADVPTVSEFNARTVTSATYATATNLATVDTVVDDISARLPAALITGRIDATVGAMQTNVLTATAIAGDAITAAKLSSDVATEIQSGLATASALSSVASGVTAIELDTQDIQSRLPAALVSGRIDASVGAMAANVMTAAAAAADLTTELQSGLATAAALATVDTIVDALLVTSDKLADTLEDSGGGAYIFTVASLVNAPAGEGGGGGGPTAAEIADAVWDELTSGHVTSGSFGVAMTTLLAGVTVASIANNAITAAAIADGAIDAGALADGLFTAAKFASNCITAAKIAGDAIGTSQLADGTITAAKIATDALTSTKIDASFGSELAAALLDLTSGVETGLTVRQHMRLSASALFGKASGLETTEAIYRDFGDTKARLTATVDSNGNRTAIVRDAT